MTTAVHTGTPGGIDQPIRCRLCGGSTAPRFTLDLIHRHRVQFHECADCGSLQADTPHWLDEAYSNSNLARLDTGAVQRNLTNLAAVYAWTKVTAARTVVDIGGGDGLLCRLLRDYGIDARIEDRYATNSYAQGFDGGERQVPIVYTAFELLEHFADPARDLHALFDARPDSLVVSTALYHGQGADWWYLTPDSGQHVFFYTPKAMEMIGKRFGYAVAFMGNYTVFMRDARLSSFKMALARMAMGSIGSRLLRSALMLLPARGAVKDFHSIAGRGI
ncbi:class I SAM-dependent methyltransferase [Sphingomonas sp.]|jgi:hypothetical protein|uniref:class I SAM-dependent methyltransferase n=1 Tax=Sphingomonas sp. TaxID=28214 RepID=UPI0035C85321